MEEWFDQAAKTPEQELLFMNSFFVVLTTFVASFLVWVMFVGLFILWVIDGKIKKEQVVHALFAIAVAWLFSEITKTLIHSQRPFEINGWPTHTLTTPNGNSFPSTHAAIAFSLAVSIWMHDKKIGALYIISALFVGLARVFANVHFTTDIIAGAFLGTIVSYSTRNIHLFSLLTRARLKRRK